LERLMIALINPGPRHAATRAAMNAGIGRTATAHILPIALSVQGGAHLGGAEVEAAMRFIAANQSLEPAAVLTAHPAPESPGDKRPFPGFGSLYGGIDPLAARFAAHLARLPGAGGSLAWGNAVAEQLREEGMGWLLPGLAAAVFCDLGFPARAGAGLFQLLTAPGLLAHGLEMATRPITAMPFLDAEHYVIEPN
jgi:citrate synthase